MAIALPANVDTTPADDMLYLGFSRQDLKFHQALGELIDNAISSYEDTSRFKIEIHIEKNGETVRVVVADSGLGIAFDDLQTKILKIGGKGTRAGKLNEHGFGLKNAVCVLTQNKRPFSIITRDQAAVDDGVYLKVDGPFRIFPNMQIVETDEPTWSENITLCTGSTGTRIHATTTMHYLRNLSRGQARFETLMERLLEHLGVMYRGYLQANHAEMLLRFRDISAGNAPWTNKDVKPIPVPYSKAKEEWLQVNVGGTEYRVQYKWGSLDEGQVAANGLRQYYQGNIKTQGVDIQVRGRVILPHQITYLWPDREPHGDLNHFVGELIIDDDIFSTVNNKVELDPNNPAWEAISEKLQEDEYKPVDAVGVMRTEADIREKLAANLKNVVKDSETTENAPTWEEVGVKVDLVHRKPGGDEDIHEIKAGTAKPIDVYQLVMYWDAKVEAGVRPKLGRLVTKLGTQSVDRLITYWNTRKDKGGQPYVFEFKRVDEIAG